MTVSVSFDDVAGIATALPETEEKPVRGNRAWRVRDKLFVWERPLTKADLRALDTLGAPPPEGPLLGIRTDGLDDKDAVLAAQPVALMTIPHFDGYPAVLARLEVIEPAVLRELIVDAWLSRAPPKLAAAYLAGRDAGA